jgi:hypothetical protein
MKNKYRSKQLEAAHRLAKDLVSVGMLPKKTLRDLNNLRRVPHLRAASSR